MAPLTDTSRSIVYDETFSPVAKLDTLKMLQRTTASGNLQLLLFDVETSFLYEVLQEEVSTKQPEGYNVESSRVHQLKKSLYGLKQAPCFWNKRFVEFISNHGLKSFVSDPCLCMRVNETRKLLVIIYVDHGLVIGNDK